MGSTVTSLKWAVSATEFES